MIPIHGIRSRRVVVIVHPVESANPRGDIIRDYGSSATRAPVDWSVYADGASAEIFGDRDMASTVATVLMSAGVAVGRHDAVEVDGARYGVDGVPVACQSASGVLDHVAVALKRWE